MNTNLVVQDHSGMNVFENDLKIYKGNGNDYGVGIDSDRYNRFYNFYNKTLNKFYDWCCNSPVFSPNIYNCSIYSNDLLDFYIDSVLCIHLFHKLFGRISNISLDNGYKEVFHLPL